MAENFQISEDQFRFLSGQSINDIEKQLEDQARFDYHMQPFFSRLVRGEISQDQYDRAKQYYLSESDGYPLARDNFRAPQRQDVVPPAQQAQMDPRVGQPVVQPPAMFRPTVEGEVVGQPRMMEIPIARRDRPVPTAPERTVPELGAVPEPKLKFEGLLGAGGVVANAIEEMVAPIVEKRKGRLPIGDQELDIMRQAMSPDSQYGTVRVEDRPINEPMRIVPGEGPPQERLQRMPSNLTLGQAREMARTRPDVAMQSDLGMVRAANEYDLQYRMDDASPQLNEAMQRNNIGNAQIKEAQQVLSSGYGTSEHFKKLMRPEVAFGLALAFNNMRAFPNAQYGQYLSQQLQNIQAQKVEGQKLARASEMTERRAQWFEGKNRPDLAELTRSGGEEGFTQAMGLYTQKPAETYRPLTTQEKVDQGIDPSLNVQVNTTTGQLSGFAGKPPTTNITVGGEGGFKRMGEQFAEQDVELVGKAEKAVGRIENLNNTSEAIIRGAVSEGQEGFETGPFAELRKSVDEFLVGFGSRDEARVNRLSDAELINATLGADVFGAIGELGIGARGLDTPNEREFLRQVLTGTISTTPSALLYMSYIRQKLQKNVIQRYNDYLARGVYGPYAETRGMTAIESPPTIFGREFEEYKEMQDWLAEQKSKRQSESGETGTVTKGGITYEIEEVQ